MARESICGSDMMADRLNVIKHKLALLNDATMCQDGLSEQACVGMHWIIREMIDEIEAVMKTEEAGRVARKEA